MKKILHLEYDRYSTESIKKLSQFFAIEAFDCADQCSLYEKLSGESYEAIFTRLGLMIDCKAIDLQPLLKHIVTPTTGLNHIDVEAAQNRGVHIISLKGEFEFLSQIKSTAEHTWSLLLGLIRHLPSAHSNVLEGKWDRNPFLSDELNGGTLGIIGYGRLGKIVARYGQAFGMNVLAYDVSEKAYHGDKYVKPTSLNGLLNQSDYIVLLIAWSKENENFMDKHKFGQMKKGSYFINTSRGELVDETALLNALQSGHVAGAALDVLHGDSSWSGTVEKGRALVNYAKQHKNLILTPHMGGYGKESIRKTRVFVADKFLNLVSA